MNYSPRCRLDRLLERLSEVRRPLDYHELGELRKLAQFVGDGTGDLIITDPKLSQFGHLSELDRDIARNLVAVDDDLREFFELSKWSRDASRDTIIIDKKFSQFGEKAKLLWQTPDHVVAVKVNFNDPP